MSELYRVLEVGCWAILQVPIAAGTTVEDPTVMIPKERDRLFGQYDHVRRYGRTIRIVLWRQASRLLLILSCAS
jgi:hypothetical protein